jgi:glycolate oxidase
VSSPSAFLADLVGAIPGERIVTHPETLDGLRRDQTPLIEAGRPIAGVYPISTDEVSAVVRVAARHQVPVVPRGAGSGLAGGANAIDGSVVLSLMRMDKILEINAEDLIAVTQPGVLNANLGAAVKARGLFYAPDPSSYEISSIGGNLATNAGGLRCLKYGVTREAALALEVVLADGDVVRVGRRSVKGVAGYDLVGLFIGSEGTLGVITEATLRLRPQPPATGSLLASFQRLTDAARAVSGITAAGVLPSVLELMDRSTILAVEEWRNLGLDTTAAAILIAGSDTANFGAAELEAIEAVCRAAGASEVLRSTDALESEGLLEARRAAYPALERLGIALLEDVAVPRSAIVPLIEKIERIAEENDIRIGTFGHVGDGNLHPTLVIPRGDTTASTRAMTAGEAILRETLSLGGTLSGEHGIGLLKRDLLADELGLVGTRISRAIKGALDPLDILNPGKALPPDIGWEAREEHAGQVG